MTVSTGDSSFHPTSTAGRLRKVAAAALVITSAFSLSACSGAISSVFSPSVTPLPSLDESQTTRDYLARTEAAITWRARELATKATRCADCADVSSSIAEAAQARLTALGGVWQPWPADLPQSEAVERPFPVAEAPTQPAEFVQWMIEGARRDLVAVTKGEFGTRDRLVVAASAAARVKSAAALAKTYGVEVDLDSVIPDPSPDTAKPASAAPTLPAADKASSVRSIDPAELDAVQMWAQWGWKDGVSADLSAQSGAIADSESAENQALSLAVQMWDCAAQDLPGLGVETDQRDFANATANDLLSRSSRVLALGVADRRINRCHAAEPSLDLVARQSVSADLHMLLSADPRLATLGARYLIADLATWEDTLNYEELAGLIQPVPAQK